MAPDKRKKHHDKDKYYRLAKEQGLRSRAAFKLSQINRKFKLLEGAKVVLDLCAAPGGWTQVVARAMPRNNKVSGIIVAVDILPIRPHPGVVTIVGDITTEKCKADIRKELQGAACDLVLHDGAPNVGASYDKDAYEQNEIALHSLKCATQHLKPKGNYVTKLYRSRDYASFLWVVKQLFETVQAVKPSSSRSQSAEIFLVCENYRAANTKIDTRLLDPRYIFEQVEGDSTGGGNLLEHGKNFNVFHKNWDSQRRKRGGYDMEHLDATMQHIQSVSEFMKAKRDPIFVLSTCSGMAFQCAVCRDTNQAEDDAEKKNNKKTPCLCNFYLNHHLTTAEIKACVGDLKLLNKSDFKGLLTWRTKLQDALKERQEREAHSCDEDDAMDSDDDENTGVRRKKEKNQNLLDSDDEENAIQAEILEMKRRRLREKKKIKKKERVVMAKRRKRAALGMDLNAIEVPDHDEVFTLATITSKGALEVAREVDLGKVTDEQLAIGDNNEDDKHDLKASVNSDGQVESHGENDDVNEDTGYSYRLDRELDDAYDKYIRKTKDGLAKTGTRHAKRSKKLKRQKKFEEAHEDTEMMLINEDGIDNDTKIYAQMLQGPNDSSDEASCNSANSEDDRCGAEPLTPEEYGAKKVATGKKRNVDKKNVETEANPLIYEAHDDPKSVKTGRWFSNPLFKSLGSTAQLAAVSSGDSKQLKNMANYEDEEGKDENMMSTNSEDDDNSCNNSKNFSSKRKLEKEGISADEVLAMMPKTDKQARHEKRLKALERLERKKTRQMRQVGEEANFEVTPGTTEYKGEAKLEWLSTDQKKKALEDRALIKAGMGLCAANDTATGFEVVSTLDTQRSLPIMDNRKYNSENEDYDSDDYAQTLALGTMILRRSKAKALVDASYNRFAWNDPEDLPAWFIDDENRHYRPQLPIPDALMEKMKEKIMAAAVRPIAKVAEARARKHKRARLKLTTAKKKAESVAANPDMSETMKLKAISKAMRGQDSSKGGKGTPFAVAKRGVKGQKGVRSVDKRMKSDKRGMDRAESRRSGGARK